MAEIVKDIYSLEFDSSSFTAELKAAIAQVENLQVAMEDAAATGQELEGIEVDLAESFSNLDTVLKKDAKSVDDLNKKQKVLTTTQSGLKKESAALSAVTAENVKTQKQLSTETANTTKNSKSLGGTLVDGARKINSVKRAAGLLTGAFRLLGALNPLAFLLSALPTVIGFFGGLFGATTKANSALDKLSDSNTGLEERGRILEAEIEKLNDIENRRGSLTDEEKAQRDELTQKYKDTSAEIIKVEEERLTRLTDLQNKAARLRVKLLGDGVLGVIEGAKVEDAILRADAGKRADFLIKEINRVAKLAAKAREENNFEAAKERDKEANNLITELDAANKVLLLEAESATRERNEKLAKLAEEAAAKRKQAAKEEADFNRKLLDDEADDIERRTKEIQDAIKDEQDLRDAALKDEEDRIEKLATAKQKSIDDELARLAKFQELQTIRREQQLALELLLVENERNKELAVALESITDRDQLEKAFTDINAKYSAQRTEIEKNAGIKIAQDRIAVLEQIRDFANSQGLDTSETDKAIAELQLKITELQAVEIPIEADTEKVKKDLGQLLDEVTALVSPVADAIFSAIDEGYKRLISRIDDAINKSKTALDNIRSNSEEFNAQQLEIEKKRLADLEKARAQAVAREQAVAQIQIALNAAVAVAKAAAEGGIAAPFTIAATLISLIAGFAQARSAASGAFFTGTEYLERNGAKKGRDTINIRAHEGERIVPTANNLQYWDAYSAMQNGMIPANVANLFANGYLKGGEIGAISSLASLSGVRTKDVSLGEKMGANAMFFVKEKADLSELAIELQEIRESIEGLPKKMPISTFNVDGHGLYMSSKKYVGRAQMRKDRAR